MERVNIQLSELTLGQKLNLMEAIWDDLSRSEEDLKSPDWHKKILSDRESALEEGTATTSDWKIAKERIRARVK